jgi:hypothetical protein
MPEYAYPDLTVQVRKTADGAFYQYGVVVAGSFQVFRTQPASALDEDIASAAQDAAAFAASVGEAPPSVSP